MIKWSQIKGKRMVGESIRVLIKRYKYVWESLLFGIKTLQICRFKYFPTP